MPPQYIMIKEMIGIKDFQLHLKERKSKIINPITPEVINKVSIIFRLVFRWTFDGSSW